MYCPFFGLQEKPFSVTPDPRFLFLSPSHQEALGHLLYGIEERKGFITVTGEVGTGKTLICRALLERLGPHVRTALVFNSFMLEIELLRSINEDFGIRQGGGTRKELIDQLNQYLLGEFGAGRNAVLIIDEAQNLATPVLEQIRMLSNLETERGKLLQIILVGQPELRQQLARPELRQLNQRIALRYHIQPFNRQETEDYINHRLVVAGSHGGVKFSRRALTVIYRHSSGIPRKINLLCDRAMLTAYVRGSNIIERTHVRQAWNELGGQEGGGFLPLAQDMPRRRFVMVQGLILGLALTVGGGAWLGINRSKLLDLSSVVPGEVSKTSVTAFVDPSLDAAEPLGEGQTASLGGTSPDSSHHEARSASLALASDEIGVGSHSSWGAVASLTPNFPEVSGVSFASFPGEVLLRAVLVEFQRDFQPRTMSAKTTLGNVASGFGLEMLPIHVDLNRLKRFRIACLVETSATDMSAMTFLIVRGTSPEGLELTDASGNIKQLKDAEFSKNWSGQVYLFHRRDLELRRILSWGKQTPEVRMLQRRLSELGYMQIPPSGLFDDATAEAVRRLQKDHALQADGAAGPATKIVLYHLIGRSLAEVRQE
ncbi:MAG TPA: AAA family ATPase [Candidatus Tectomicrobia bacterium]|nr:AAA family ATPase [Candidatus Tectomicrobia bacterium]